MVCKVHQILAIGAWTSPWTACSSGQLAQLIKALGSLPKGPWFEPDLAPTHITCLLSPPLAIWNEAISLSFLFGELVLKRCYLNVSPSLGSIVKPLLLTLGPLQNIYWVSHWSCVWIRKLHPAETLWMLGTRLGIHQTLEIHQSLHQSPLLLLSEGSATHYKGNLYMYQISGYCRQIPGPPIQVYCLPILGLPSLWYQLFLLGHLDSIIELIWYLKFRIVCDWPYL